MSRSSITVFLLLITVSCGYSQQVDIRGRFQADSLKIGEQIPYAVTARYPGEFNILFPDSTYSFIPFEFESKQFFRTRTINNTSYDSVVYFLTTYEIDSIQSFRMPVYLLNPGDCTQIFTNRDTIFLKHMVALMPDSVTVDQLPLKTNTSYMDVIKLLNYPLLMIIGGSIIFVVIAVWVIYGKRIRKYFIIRRLTRNHTTFLERFSKTVQPLHDGTNSRQVEAALVIWKQYMERLEERPYTKFTSKEILRIEQNERLAATLYRIDRVIYGGFGGELQPFFSDLREHTQLRFAKKLEVVKHE